MAATAILAFGLFGTALVIAGFVVAAAIDSHVLANEGQSTTLAQATESHQLALRFFTPGIFLVFVSMGLLSAPMLHRVFHARWLGIMGQVIGVVAVTSYLSGITGPDWNVMQTAGTLMMAAFAWHLLVGSRALLVKSHALLLQPD